MTPDEFKQAIPPVREIKSRLDRLFAERRFLRELLKLAERREAAEQAAREAATPCK